MEMIVRPEITWHAMSSFDKKADNPPCLVTDGYLVTIAQWVRHMKQKYQIDMGIVPEMVLDREYWVIGYGEKGQALYLEKTFQVIAWSPVPRAPDSKTHNISHNTSVFATDAKKKGARGLML